MLSKPYTGKGSDPLVDGTSEVLEREGIDEGFSHRGGVRFRAKLEHRMRSLMSIDTGERGAVHLAPSSWIDH